MREGHEIFFHPYLRERTDQDLPEDTIFACSYDFHFGVDSILENLVAQTSSVLQSRSELQQLGERVVQVAEEID